MGEIFLIGLDADSIRGKDIRPVQGVGEIAVAFGFALSAEDAFGGIKADTAAVLGGIGAGKDGEFEFFGRVSQQEFVVRSELIVLSP
jgi:hypothetical protein